MCLIPPMKFERSLSAGEVEEDTYDWYAQDAGGNV